MKFMEPYKASWKYWHIQTLNISLIIIIMNLKSPSTLKVSS